MPKSIVVPANLRASGGAEGRVFHPSRREKPKFGYKNHGYLSPNKWRSDEPMLAARLFVGFSVKKVPTYEMDDLVKIVKRVRKEQQGMPDSSFIYQKGVYTHQDNKEVVTEDAAQVVLLNLANKSRQEFVDEMITLAEVIREELGQESVILEIQKGGIVQETFGIDASDWDAGDDDDGDDDE